MREWGYAHESQFRSCCWAGRMDTAPAAGTIVEIGVHTSDWCAHDAIRLGFMGLAEAGGGWQGSILLGLA